MTEPEFSEDEKQVYQEFIDLFNLPSMASDIDEGQKKVVASLGVGIYRQARVSERKKVVEEVEGWLVDEFTEEIDWRCPKCREYVEEGKYCTNDRSKPIKEVWSWENDKQEAHNQLCAELRTKLAEMKARE